MRIRHIIIGILLFLGFNSAVHAQPLNNNGEYIQSRVLILLDESSSMIQPWEGPKEKYRAAREIILKLMDSIYAYNPDVEFSLRVFGHQYTVQQNNCYDTKTEVNFTKSNRAQMELRLMDIRPLGVTPIAYSLMEAADKDLVDEAHHAYSIILLTDGGESCGGDLCGVIRNLIARKVFLKPYIIGLEDVPELKSSYACMGNFLSVTKEAQVNDAVNKIVEAFKPIIRITRTQYAEIQRGGPKDFGAPTPAQEKPKEKQVEKIVEQPKAPILPVAVKINHLAVITTHEIEVPKIVIDKLKTFPNPALEEVVDIMIPTMIRIAKIAPANLKPLDETNVQSIFLKLASIPTITEEVSEQNNPPKVPSINHIEPAALIKLQETPGNPAHINQKQINFKIEEQPENVIPQSTSIAHVNTSDLIALNVPKIDPTKLNLAPIPAVIEEIETRMPPTTQPISHLSPAKVHVQEPELPSLEPVHRVKNVPSVKEEEPVKMPEVVKINHLAPAKMKLNEPLLASIEPVKPIKNMPPIIEEKEMPLLPPIPKISRINAAGLKESKKADLPKINFDIKQVAVPAVDVKDIPQKPTAQKITRLKTARLIEPKVIFIIEDHVLKQRTPPPAPPLPAPPAAPAPKTTAPIPSASLLAAKPSLAAASSNSPPKRGITSGYTVETIEAKQTSLMVYFTNGHGKFYASTPLVLLQDPFSNRLIKKFYRTIDPNGNPDPQLDIPPGVYNIAIAEKRNLVLHDVEIVEKKMNKVIVKLKNCSLEFQYDKAPDRPVSEFVATVIERNVPNGKVINQKCTQKLEYEPGNYHIVIHTYPEDVRNVDLDFDDTKVILLPQPGFVKINTTMKRRKLNMYKPVNDRFLQFDSKSSSDTVLNHLQIQPGQYQVRYLKDPTKPYAKETIVSFAVKSNEVTEVELPGN